MLNWFKKLFKKKENNNFTVLNPCSTCVYWKSEEENNKEIISGGLRFCDVHKKYTSENYTCIGYREERFEATPDSTSTPELELNHELSINEDNQNNTEN